MISASSLLRQSKRRWGPIARLIGVSEAERSVVEMAKHDEQGAAALRPALQGYKAFNEERFDDAARLLQRSVDLGQDLKWVHAKLVDGYGKLGDLEKRAQALKRLRELHPDAEVPCMEPEKAAAD